jgi:hypothetical protein
LFTGLFVIFDVCFKLPSGLLKAVSSFKCFGVFVSFLAFFD